ncbi:T9SS type A sorting domain-containing protein [Flavobacteriaceae bacterium]|nr:T9SS type A sorting domain-containing protein [Flavobacteriaceae bacterium]
MKKKFLTLFIIAVLIQTTKAQTDIPCEQKTWVVNVGSIEDHIDIYHSGHYLTSPREENVITWTVTDNQGSIIAQETLIDEDHFDFYHDIPTTDTMNISALLINEVAGVACFVEDVLFWDTNNRWEFLNGNVPILGANDFIETTVSLYPNPSNELINISFDEDQLSKLEFYDITGKLLFKKELNTNTYALNIANYPSGTYIVKVFNQNNVSVNKKIIKK